MSSFQLPKLSYDYDELEPHIDSNTLSIHHGKHHDIRKQFKCYFRKLY